MRKIKYGGIALVSVFVIFFLLQSLPTSYAESEKLVIGRMKVTIMPEYESTDVLVIQEGKFADRTAFPANVRFNLPNEVNKLYDVCSLSPGGQHFCQIYEIGSEKNMKFVDVGLPFSDFFIDFKYAPFEVKRNSNRAFEYSVENPYDVMTLEVHIQKPYRSENFSVSPANAELYEKREFEYLKYVFKDVKAGERKSFSVTYFKKDIAPSVNIKYTGVMQQAVFEENKGEYILIAGLALLGVILYMRFRKPRVSKG
jgi:hypothetical protein